MSSFLSFISQSTASTDEDTPVFEVDRYSLAASSSEESKQDEDGNDLFMSVQSSPTGSMSGDAYLSAKSCQTEERGDSIKSNSSFRAKGSLLFSDGPAWLELQQEIIERRTANADNESDVADLIIGMKEELRWRNSVSINPEIASLLAETDPTFCPMECPSTSRFESGHLPSPTSTSVVITSPVDGIDDITIKRDSTVSCVDLARRILINARHSYPPRDAHTFQWLQDAIENPTTLLTSFSSADEVHPKGKIPNLSRTSDELGNFEVARIRDRWIFDLHPNRNIRAVLESQRHCCAGCGLSLDSEYQKRIRFCEYYGSVFCFACHDGGRGIIPAKILHSWNFTRLPICDRAMQFLAQAQLVPSIHISTAAPHLVKTKAPLRHTIALRRLLRHALEYVKTCSQAQSAMIGKETLPALFSALPSHILDADVELFSLADLESVRNGLLQSQMEELVALSRTHIESCLTCVQQSFVCWLCMIPEDHLFPFQVEKVHRCEACGSLAHTKCFEKARKQNANFPPECSKCKRMQNSRTRRRFVSACEE